MLTLLKNKNFYLRAFLAFSLVAILSLSFSSVAFAADPPVPAPEDIEEMNNLSKEFLGVTDRIRPGSCGLDPLCAIIRGLRLIIIGLVTAVGSLFALLMGVAAYLAELMLQLGTQIPQLNIVTKGFKIVLSFTNVIFVIAIIVMAFSTILRFSSYGFKALFKRLVLMAILVNFSFLIGGFILDVSNVFTDSFVSGFNPAKIGKAMNPQQIILKFGVKTDAYQLATDTGETVIYTIRGEGEIDKKVTSYQIPLNESDWGQFFRVLQGVTVAVILTFILMITLFAIAFMTLVRNIYVAFLLIIMPIIWPLSVFPYFKKYWTEWWETFLKWATFLPIMTFFVWLGVTTAAVTLNDTTKSLSGVARNNESIQLTFLIFEVLLIAGILLGGLKVAKRSSIIGSAAIFAGGAWVGSKLKRGGKRLAVGTAKTVARNPVRTAAVVGGAATGGLIGAGLLGGIANKLLPKQEGKKAAQATTRGASRVLSHGAMRWIPGAKQAANALGGVGDMRGERAKKEVEEYQKKNLTNLSDGELDVRLKSPDVRIRLKRGGQIDHTENAALAAEAKKRNKIKDISPENLPAIIGSLKQKNPGTDVENIPDVKEIIKSNPTLAADILYKPKKGTPVEEIVTERDRIIRKYAAKVTASKIESMPAAAFDYGRAMKEGKERGESVRSTLLGLSKGTVSALARSSEEQAATVRKSLELILEKPPTTPVSIEAMDGLRNLREQEKILDQERRGSTEYKKAIQEMQEIRREMTEKSKEGRDTLRAHDTLKTMDQAFAKLS